jgi:subtilisin family serine protease
MGMNARRRCFLLSAVAVLVSTVIGAPLSPVDAAPTAAKDYIVVLKNGTSPRQVANEHSNRHNAQVRHVYGHALRGYAATIPAHKVDEVKSDSRVSYVEADGVVTASAQTIPWGIDRVGADTSSTQAGNGSGAVSNVNVYVIDTGVYAHSDLNRVGHVNFAAGKNDDCHGHGTHVAGTIAAKDDTSSVVGIAPGAPVTGVKVLSCSGSGSTSGVIKGVDWVTANAKKPAIANMSLGGGLSNAMDNAVRNSAASGVFYAVAAGNSTAPACNSSPARAGAGSNNGIATVAATARDETEASWSNYGSCVDIWAPGVSVLSTRKGGGTTTMSGTSMASPHVGGGGALYLSTHTLSTATDVEAALTGAADLTGKLSKDGRAITREFVGGF